MILVNQINIFVIVNSTRISVYVGYVASTLSIPTNSLNVNKGIDPMSQLMLSLSIPKIIENVDNPKLSVAEVIAVGVTPAMIEDEVPFGKVIPEI